MKPPADLPSLDDMLDAMERAGPECGYSTCDLRAAARRERAKARQEGALDEALKNLAALAMAEQAAQKARAEAFREALREHPGYYCSDKFPCPWDGWLESRAREAEKEAAPHAP